MKFQALVRMATTLALLYAGISVLPGNVCAQVIDFSQIDAFESMGTGTLRGASPPKTIVDDDERHTIFMTIWEADTDTKVYWKSLDDNLPRTTTVDMVLCFRPLVELSDTGVMHDWEIRSTRHRAMPDVPSGVPRLG